jgi:hypothetical protein
VPLTWLQDASTNSATARRAHGRTLIVHAHAALLAVMQEKRRRKTRLKPRKNEHGRRANGRSIIHITLRRCNF